MNDPHPPQDVQPGETGPTDSRRDFLKRMAATGAAAGLTHFVMLGGARKALALADCTVSSPDSDCPNYVGDNCTASNPDSCQGSGTSTSDDCDIDSPDKCLGGDPKYDACTASSPDVCNPSVSGSDNCEPGFAN